MRVNGAGNIALLSAHAQRFCLGLHLLGLAAPDPLVLARDLAALARNHPSRAIKLIGVAAADNLGYRRNQTDCSLFFHSFELPASDQTLAPHGLKLVQSRVCVSAQAALQGAKSLARMDQVLAANALSLEQDADEALMLTTDGRLCCAISANLFFYADQCWHTPELGGHGVHGVMRRTLLEQMAKHQIPIKIADYTVADLAQAQELILCNALRGVRAVRSIAQKPHPLHFDSQGPNTQMLIEWVTALGFYT